MKVLIIGGGIGGLATAQALAKSGVDFEVHERSSEATDWLQGYRIHVNPHGCAALKRCLPERLWEAFAATSGDPGAGMCFQTNRLKELVFIPEELMTGGSGQQRAVNRIALRKLLLAGLGNRVHFGQDYDRYELNADGTVTAYFKNGTSATGDLLIGADGANSLVRSQLLPTARRITSHSVGIAGRLALTEETRAWLPIRIQHGLNLVLPPAGSFMFSAVFDGRTRTAAALGGGLDLTDFGLDVNDLLENVEDYVIWAYAAKDTTLPADIDTDQTKLDGSRLLKLTADRIRGWHPDLRRMVAESDQRHMGAIRFKYSSPVDPWPTTKVTLLGDAVHNMTPARGLGANTALRDAALLSHQLIAVHRGEAELLAAVGEYERRMLKYGFEAVDMSREFAERMTSGNAFARQGMKTWLRLCGALPAMKRKAFGGEWADDLPDRAGLSVH